MSLFKNDIIDAIAKKTGATKSSIQSTIDAFQDVVVESLKKGSDISLIGFLNFKVVATKARNAKNPKTGKEIKVPAGKKVKVVLGKSVKESVKKK
ncbi:MAG: HU family DNA-binding protein [Rickettsiales bacterium]|jgi:DNA-binding protein HU-beta|nr:HU family DNA-binding protein [Rickettsiales bacterium]